MAKFTVTVTLAYKIEVEAKNGVEAEQLARDDFIDEQGWDAKIVAVAAQRVVEAQS